MSFITGLAKASITRLDTSIYSSLESLVLPRHASVDVMFNPKELVIDKSNEWTWKPNEPSNVPTLEFASGRTATLTMELFFDTYIKRIDVRKAYTDRIYELMFVDPDMKDSISQRGRPPRVRFQWGRTIGFDAVITSISQRFTLFLPEDGTPVRAVLNVTFSQIADELFYPKQNPTSGGEGGEKLWVVGHGDTLHWIAYQEYHDATKWKLIADANRLSNVRDLKPGVRLLIPSAR